MRLTLKHRERHNPILSDELDHLAAVIATTFGREHDANGRHSHIQAASLTFSGPIALGQVISPPVLVANQHNYSPPGFATATVVRLEASGARTITGFDTSGIRPGQLILVCNVGSGAITLAHDDAASFSVNRLYNGGSVDKIFNANDCAFLWHDAISLRWRNLKL